MAINIHGYVKLARTLAEKHGLTIRFKPTGDDRTAYTDGNVIYLPQPNAMLTEDEQTSWLYLLFHEIGHNHPLARDCFSEAEERKVDLSSFFGRVWNYLEDYRQEKIEYAKYRGKELIMNRGRYLYVSKHIDEWLNNVPTDEIVLKYGSLWAWGEELRVSFQPSLVGQGQRLAKSIPPQWVDKLKSGDYGFVLNDENLTAAGTFELARRICKEVFELEDDESGASGQQQGSKPNDDKQQGKSDESSKGSSSEGTEGNEPGSSGQDTSPQGDQKEPAEGSKAGKEHGKPGEVNIKEKLEVYFKDLSHEHSSGSSFNHGKAGRILYDEKDIAVDPRGFVVCPENQMKIYDFSKHTGGKIITPSSPDMTRVNGGKLLSSKVRRLLQIISKARYQYGQKKGRLHQKNLYRATMKDAKGYNERVFKRKQDNFTLDVAVTVLVDFSSSMSGSNKIGHAAEATVMLNDAIGKLNVPLEILGFTTSGATPIHMIFKGFMQKITEEKLISHMSEGLRIMDRNSDGEAVLWAYNRLIQRKEKRKILIVLSDGQPSGIRNQIRQPAFLKYVIENIIDRKEVEVYGIGIMNGSVDKFYPQWKVITQASELEEALLTVVKDKILKQ